MAGLKGKTLFVTGASRGIGLAIAKRAARDGANVAIVAKTQEPNPKLEGTVETAAAEVEAAGGRALALACDIRFEEEIERAVAATVAAFGGIDICVNNASALSLSPIEDDHDQAPRPDARHQHARHLPRHQGLPAAPAQGGEPARAHAVAAARHAAPVVCRPRRLFDRQVRHEPVRAGARRGAEGRRHRRQRAVAAHDDCHRGDPQRAGRRGRSCA